MTETKLIQPHLHFPDRAEAVEYYLPFTMTQCPLCENWHPDQYRCPACGYDQSDD